MFFTGSSSSSSCRLGNRGPFKYKSKRSLPYFFEKSPNKNECFFRYVKKKDYNIHKLNLKKIIFCYFQKFLGAGPLFGIFSQTNFNETMKILTPFILVF